MIVLFYLVASHQPESLIKQSLVGCKTARIDNASYRSLSFYSSFVFHVLSGQLKYHIKRTLQIANYFRLKGRELKLRCCNFELPILFPLIIDVLSLE